MPGDWRAQLVDDLRALINEGAPGVEEEAKWRKASNPDGVPTFTLDGLVCTVETYKDKIKVTFAKGASLPDPAKLFNASLDAGVRRVVHASPHTQGGRPANGTPSFVLTSNSVTWPPRVVEVAGIEPASDDEKPGLLRVQCATEFLGPRARTHTFPDRPSWVRVPRSPPT